jgi:Cys-tRNA(Pro)/Cys-tRNA(Cys) deacylase
MNAKKTNVLRLLDAAGIACEVKEYAINEVDSKDPPDLSGVHAAELLGLPAEMIFKTLVLKGASLSYIVCCIPVAGELDLKKAARAAGEKSIELIPVKELQPLTGYVRGGCSPIGMKKPFPTFIDETAELFDRIGISAGQRGMQVLLAPGDLASFVSAVFADLCTG